MIDIHCHIIPGIDDGAEDWEQAVEMAKIAVQDGISGIVCTPHWSPAFPENKRTAILAAVEEFRARLDLEGVDLDIYPGCELAIDFNLPEKIKERELLSLNDGGKFILIEMPTEVLPLNPIKFFFMIQAGGLTPILAHPERNWLLMKKPSMLQKWVEAGVLVQITGDSLAGSFGRRVRGFCIEMLRCRMVHFVASDSHNSERRKPVLSEAHDIIASIAGPEAARKMFFENPASILRGEYPDIEDSISPERKKEKSLIHRLLPFWHG